MFETNCFTNEYFLFNKNYSIFPNDILRYSLFTLRIKNFHVKWILFMAGTRWKISTGKIAQTTHKRLAFKLKKSKNRIFCGKIFVICVIIFSINITTWISRFYENKFNAKSCLITPSTPLLSWQSISAERGHTNLWYHFIYCLNLLGSLNRFLADVGFGWFLIFLDICKCLMGDSYADSLLGRVFGSVMARKRATMLWF